AEQHETLLSRLQENTGELGERTAALTEELAALPPPSRTVTEDRHGPPPGVTP
ncbi:hypothetical protein HGB46_28405, partial [Nocardiopsis dassonvillei]|nr:hypothetical protein [Nocardiopsis dassonvillei]